MNDGKIFFHEVGLNPGWAKHNKHVIIDKKIIFYFQEKGILTIFAFLSSI